jgi:hypothetical protein
VRLRESLHYGAPYVIRKTLPLALIVGTVPLAIGYRERWRLRVGDHEGAGDDLVYLIMVYTVHCVYKRERQ